MDSSSECDITHVALNTPPITQSQGTFTITLPTYAVTRTTHDVSFSASPSRVIQTMTTGVWDLISREGGTKVNFLVYPQLRKGTFSAGWKKFIKLNGFKGGEMLTFVVPDQLISDGKAGLMWVVEGPLEAAAALLVD